MQSFQEVMDVVMAAIEDIKRRMDNVERRDDTRSTVSSDEELPPGQKRKREEEGHEHTAQRPRSECSEDRSPKHTIPGCTQDLRTPTATTSASNEHSAPGPHEPGSSCSSKTPATHEDTATSCTHNSESSTGKPTAANEHANQSRVQEDRLPGSSTSSTTKTPATNELELAQDPGSSRGTEPFQEVMNMVMAAIEDIKRRMDNVERRDDTRSTVSSDEEGPPGQKRKREEEGHEHTAQRPRSERGEDRSSQHTIPGCPQDVRTSTATTLTRNEHSASGHDQNPDPSCSSKTPATYEDTAPARNHNSESSTGKPTAANEHTNQSRVQEDRLPGSSTSSTTKTPATNKPELATRNEHRTLDSNPDPGSSRGIEKQRAASNRGSDQEENVRSFERDNNVTRRQNNQDPGLSRGTENQRAASNRGMDQENNFRNFERDNGANHRQNNPDPGSSRGTENQRAASNRGSDQDNVRNFERDDANRRRNNQDPGSSRGAENQRAVSHRELNQEENVRNFERGDEANRRRNNRDWQRQHRWYIEKPGTGFDKGLFIYHVDRF